MPQKRLSNLTILSIKNDILKNINIDVIINVISRNT